MVLQDFTNTLYTILTGIKPSEETLIKLHSRYLEKLGDLSFPIPMKNWQQNSEKNTIFELNLETDCAESAFKVLQSKLDGAVKIRTYKVIKSSLHLFLERPCLFGYGVQKTLEQELVESPPLQPIEIDPQIDLTTLRQAIVNNTLLRLSSHQPEKTIQCGPVLNEQGVKNTTHTAQDFFTKRATDMELMAQHRYRTNIKSPLFFEKLGKGSVIIELLSNKPHKPMKILFNDPNNGANKGPAFIFYNCARLSILLKEFDSRVTNGVYPPLPPIETTDFNLLTNHEEWELLYVYILQFPLVVKQCQRGNVQNLITFLANLSSTFSVYYRRVRILIEPRPHMLATIHARIYLLKSLQIIFHNALSVLNIEPINEM